MNACAIILLRPRAMEVPPATDLDTVGGLDVAVARVHDDEGVACDSAGGGDRLNAARGKHVT
eukprot:1170317-Pyramimonas_sp.AAC.1